MGRFALGLAIGLCAGGAAGGGAAFLLLRQTPAVVAPPPDKPAAPAAPVRGPKKRAVRPSGDPVAVPTDETIVVSAADRQVITAGEALQIKETLDMTQPDARDLSSSEIDGTIGQRSDAIIRCLAQARGAAPVNGRIILGLVVDGNGRVTRTRVEAPAYLIHHGLYECARKVAVGIRFPAVGKSTVITVPFDVSD